MNKIISDKEADKFIEKNHLRDEIKKEYHHLKDLEIKLPAFVVPYFILSIFVAYIVFGSLNHWINVLIDISWFSEIISILITVFIVFIIMKKGESRQKKRKEILQNKVSNFKDKYGKYPL